LKRSEPDREEDEPPVVDLHLLALHIRRVLDHNHIHDDRDDADGDVDVEDPPPRESVRDPAAQKRATSGRPWRRGRK